MPSIITFGEMLIDFVPTTNGVSLSEATTFIKAAGGAPANVAVGLARLGVSCGFMGQVGDDAFGHFLARTLQENHVDTAELKFSPHARTALAFVSLKADGERDFMFYRHPSTDMLYSYDQVNVEYVHRARIFHFGSISLIDDPIRRATLFAIETAKQAGAVISYDPNLRLPLWRNSGSAREGMMLGWRLANVIKVSEDELDFLGGNVEKLWHDDLRLLVVTRGKDGCAFVRLPKFARLRKSEVAGFKVKSVDTTGAGDGFVAGLLSGLLTHPHAVDDEETLRAICRRANAVGAITTTKRGAIPSLPTSDEVDRFLKSY
jgi:fructokinase